MRTPTLLDKYDFLFMSPWNAQYLHSLGVLRRDAWNHVTAFQCIFNRWYPEGRGWGPRGISNRHVCHGCAPVFTPNRWMLHQPYQVRVVPLNLFIQLKIKLIVPSSNSVSAVKIVQFRHACSNDTAKIAVNFMCPNCHLQFTVFLHKKYDFKQRDILLTSCREQ